MVEFILRGEIDECFGLDASAWPDAFQVPGRACVQLDALTIQVDGVGIELSPEPVGWQVSFEDGCDSEWAADVAAGLCANISRVSGQAGRVIPI
jgi:hypothetical protein